MIINTWTITTKQNNIIRGGSVRDTDRTEQEVAAAEGVLVLYSTNNRSNWQYCISISIRSNSKSKTKREEPVPSRAARGFEYQPAVWAKEEAASSAIATAMVRIMITTMTMMKKNPKSNALIRKPSGCSHNSCSWYFWWHCCWPSIWILYTKNTKTTIVWSRKVSKSRRR